MTSTSVPATGDRAKVIVDEAAADYLAESANAGLAIGIIAWDEERVFCYGVRDKASGAPVDGDTLFEIGSITKLFTANLLADLVREGRVGLDDPVSKHLPTTVTVPQYDGKEITLRHLATHVSSLPRLPANLDEHVENEENPYADYTVEHLHEYLSTARLRKPIGSYCEYSNLGMGLLGNALAGVVGKGYEEVVLERVCRPLEMGDTSITLSSDGQSRFATGHSSKGAAVAHWDLPALPAAGALRSTIRDMLKYVAANLGRAPAALKPSLEMCQEVHHIIPRRLPCWRAYVGAVVLAAIGLAVQHWGPVAPGSWKFFVVYALPIVIAARRCGLWPSALCGVISVLGAALLWGGSFDGTSGAFFTLLAVWFLGKRPGGSQQRLAWQDSELGSGAHLLWHNGGTGGFCSFLGIVREERLGVVLLSNSENSVDELGVKLLESLVEPKPAASPGAN